MNLKVKRVFLAEKLSQKNNKYWVLGIEFENGYIWYNTDLVGNGGFLSKEMTTLLQMCA